MSVENNQPQGVPSTVVLGASAAVEVGAGSFVARDSTIAENFGIDCGPEGLLWTDRVLGHHGGPTRTHIPWWPPVVNAIPAGTPTLCDGTLPNDQRGLSQPFNGACDRGSVERRPSDPQLS